MPINNIKNTPEVMYMKINELAGKKMEEVRNTKQARKNVETAAAGEGEAVRARNRVRTRTRAQEVVQFKAKNMVEGAVNQAKNMPEIREEKVAQIKAQVQQGTYNVPNSEIARSMIGSLLQEIA